MRSTLRLILAAVLAVLAAGLACAVEPNAVHEMRVIGDLGRTRFVVDLAQHPDYKLLRLAKPDRLVIDMPNVEFRVPAEPAEGRGLVSDYRYGLIAPGRARVVLDLAKPIEIVNAFVLDPVGTEPARLVVDMAPTTKAAFEAAARADQPLNPAPAPAPAAEQPHGTSGLPVVVIDPGHGGIDSGAIGKDGFLEKNLTLEFALELADQLKKGGKLEPVLTRTDDTFLALGERVEIARQRKAALFISIHADTVREKYVRGATVYTLSEDASDALAQALAERENRSDVLAGMAIEDQPDDVADILFDLARRETKNFSVRFAKSLVTDMRGKVALNSNPWRRASFRVLKAPEIPSVLLELGYLSNADDEKLFKSDAWPANEAHTVAIAIEQFLAGKVAAGQ